MSERGTYGIWHLHRFDWLAALEPEELERLRLQSFVGAFGANEMVFSPESSPGELYLLESGLVRIYRVAPDGSETAFGYVAPGEIFGELALFAGYDRDSFAQTVRPSQVWKIPRAAFTQLLAGRPELALGVTRQVGSRFKRMERRVEDLVFRDARSRIADMLLELAEDFGRPCTAGITIDVEVTQTDLAALVGITRQTANVHLRELESLGLIERSGRLLTVCDRAGIERIAELGAADVPEALVDG